MSKTQVGKETSRSDSEIYSKTYQKLLRQKEHIEKELFKLNVKYFKAADKIAKGVLPTRRSKKYVSRLKNTTTLAKAIRECMTPKMEMTMKEILKSLSKKGLYSTSSSYYYTMVNNKLNRDKQIKKVSRGVFVYMPRGRRKNAA